jgi:hypothetical protein
MASTLVVLDALDPTLTYQSGQAALHRIATRARESLELPLAHYGFASVKAVREGKKVQVDHEVDRIFKLALRS